jgi:NAD(P)-dependent dehydrogenase (short-subunit alcohol dehydrogenase family)
MESKVVLITGGSSGIGRSIGNLLLNKGFRVYGSSRDLSKYRDFDDFELLQMDVRQPDTVADAVEKILQKEGRIDILVNNAGVGITGPLEEIPREEMENNFAVNFFGPLEVIKAVLPAMRNQGSGLIINITSIAGYMGLPYRAIYSASKGALELVTESLRMETKAFGIHITNLAPGDFATKIASGRYHAPVLDDSPYKDTYAKSLSMMNEHVDKGGDPQLVAEAVYRIIGRPRPKVHYRVGGLMQTLSVFLKRILPDKVFEKLLLHHYKL